MVVGVARRRVSHSFRRLMGCKTGVILYKVRARLVGPALGRTKRARTTDGGAVVMIRGQNNLDVIIIQSGDWRYRYLALGAYWYVISRHTGCDVIITSVAVEAVS